MANLFYRSVSLFILLNLLYQAIFTLSASARIELRKSVLENNAIDLFFLGKSPMSPLITGEQSRGEILIAGSSYQYIENGGYSTRSEYLKSREYQPSVDYRTFNEKPIAVQSRNPYPLTLEKPYSVNSNIICREQSDGLQLVCFPKEDAERIWGRFPN